MTGEVNGVLYTVASMLVMKDQCHSWCQLGNRLMPLSHVPLSEMCYTGSYAQSMRITWLVGLGV